MHAPHGFSVLHRAQVRQTQSPRGRRVGISLARARVAPSQAEEFLQQVQQAMRDELAALDRILPHNTDVTILPKGKGWLKRSLLAAQPEPANLLAI